MLSRFLLAAVVLVAATALGATQAAASMIPFYSNSLRSAEERAELFLEFGEQCRRGGNERLMRVRVGADTADCDLSPPVVGRDLGISVIGAVMSGTPQGKQRHAYFTTGIRVGEGGSMKAHFYPRARAIQVIKTLPDGRRGLIAAERNVQSMRGINRGNRVILRVINVGAPGNCRIVVHVNGTRAIVANDPRCPQLPGRMTTFGAGSFRSSEGITAAFRNLRVSLPDPFAR